MIMSGNPELKGSRVLGPQPDLAASDPYLVLGLPRTASQVEIKRSYFALIRQYPPETAPDKFKIVRAAYEKIKDATRRTETDIFLPQAPPVWQPPPDHLSLDANFYPADVALILRHWGDLGRTDFREDFEEIEL
jgi:curved DNA-binding protein CbpA